MKERRVSVRTNMLGVTARVSTDGSKWEKISVRDISDSGIGFIMDSEYPIDEVLILKGEVSDVTRSMEVSCEMKIIFAAKTTDEKFLYGTRFIDMSKEQRVSLGIFIELMVTKFPSLLMQ